MQAAASKPKSTKQTTVQPPQSSSGAQAGLQTEPGAVMRLQGLIGNQAVGRLLQTKLTVGSSGDSHEIEADRVADFVLRKPAANTQPCKHGAHCEKCGHGVKSAPVSVQRVSASAGPQMRAPASVDRVLARGGRPLSSPVRDDMEGRFGHDFSGVRVHTDTDAARSARELNANAYTVGDHIVFGAGRFTPQTPSGRHLLAHELTHVLQQQHGAVSRQVQRKDDDAAKLGLELIPTATLEITLNGAFFKLSAEAMFQPGPKTIQMVRIALKLLLREQYTDQIAIELTGILEARKKQFLRSGHFEDTRDAFEGEKIELFFFSIEPFAFILQFLEKRNLTVHLDDAQAEQWFNAFANVNLWNDVNRIAKKKGKPFPAWYMQPIFNAQMASHATILQEYRAALAEVRETGSAEAKEEGGAIAEQVYGDVNFDVEMLEAMRKDIALYQDPTTQAAYQSIWFLTDKAQAAGKPAPAMRSVPNALALMEFAVKSPDLLNGFRSEHAARHDLLVKFVSEGVMVEQNFKLLPPYPAFIVAPDLSEDNVTVDTAKNTFRMITETDKVHGGTLLHAVSIANKREIFYSWDVVPIPDSIKFLHDGGAKPAEVVKEADNFVKNSPKNLKTPVEKYSADRDYEQTVDMSDLGLGSFLLVGHAAPHYAEDMNWVQQPSTAGFPFFVFDAKALAANLTSAPSKALADLKDQLANTKDEKEKEALKKEIERLETRESSGLGAMTARDLKDTQTLIDAAKGLREFILLDRKQGLPVRGNREHDPFIVRLKRDFPKHHDVYMLIREMFDPRRYDDLTAIDEYLKILDGQKKQLGELAGRVADAEGRFKAGSPNYRVEATMIKEDTGQQIPLLMVAGLHPDTPAGKYKFKLVDVTFKNAKIDKMIYVGGTRDSEAEALRSAFAEFASENHYGDGEIAWRLPQAGYSGQVTSEADFWDYLQYALAALGIVLLVLGTIATAGALGPVAGAVVATLAVTTAVVGAAMSVRNMQKRDEKGTLEMDTETALDIINIIGAVVLVVGSVSKLAGALRTTTTLARELMVLRLQKLIAVYDITELGATVYLLSVKVKEDVEAINALDIPQHEKDQMISSVTFEAIQQGAMMSVSAYGTLKAIPSVYRNRVEGSSYKSWIEKGWIKPGKKGKVEVTDLAPPFLRNMSKPGKSPPPDQQGDVAHRATLVEPLAQKKTVDGQHELTLTERGRIIRCSEFCEDLRSLYAKVLAQDPDANRKLLEIEEKAAIAARNEDKVAADAALAEGRVLEDALRASDAKWKKMTAGGEPSPKIELKPLGTVKGDGKSGVKIEPIPGVEAPTRRIEIGDLMTEAEIASPSGMQLALDRLGQVVGKSVADVPILKQHWDAAVTKVLKGKDPNDVPPGAAGIFHERITKVFWAAVAADKKAVNQLKKIGLTFSKEGGPPRAVLGPAGKKKKDAAATRERSVAVGWRKDAPKDGSPLDASKMELVFHKPVIEKPRAKPKAAAPPPRQPLVFSPDEQRLATHGKTLGMLDSEVEIMVQRFRKNDMSVEEMEGHISQWADTFKQNPKARARIAPDYILDADSRAKIQHEETKIAGTGAIETITVRDDPDGGIAVGIDGTILPQRLARKAKDVTPTRRRAPDFNASKKLFSNRESYLNRFWQRLHLWGPGFGDEAAVALFWGPRDVNLKWQNSSIENYIRKLATAAQDRGMTTHVSAVAKSWGDVPGFTAPKGERFLRSVEYTITLKSPDGQVLSTIRVFLHVNQPPKGGVKAFGVEPVSGLLPTDLL